TIRLARACSRALTAWGFRCSAVSTNGSEGPRSGAWKEAARPRRGAARVPEVQKPVLEPNSEGRLNQAKVRLRRRRLRGSGLSAIHRNEDRPEHKRRQIVREKPERGSDVRRGDPILAKNGQSLRQCLRDLLIDAV